MSVSVTPKVKPKFRKKTLVTAITASLISYPSHSTATTNAYTPPKWGINTELMYYLRQGGNHKAGLRGLIPLWQDAQQMSYLDARFIDGEGTIDEANFALGHRLLSPQQQRIYGLYGGLDLRRSASGRRFNQVALGAEILGEQYDLFANYYHPITDAKQTGISDSAGNFVGNSLYSAKIYEEALKGYDVELGTKLNISPFWDRFEPRIYAKYYHFEGDKLAQKDDGFGLRFTARPRQNLLLELAWEEDELRGNQTSFTLTYAFGASSESKARALRQRMTEFHQRDIDVRETSQLSEAARTSFAPEDQVEVAGDVVHIDNAALVNGDGSFESPYSSIANCQADDCATSKVIYVHTGDSDYTTEITLDDGQRLIGQGYNWYGIGGDQAPAITTTNHTVTLADNNEVAGLSLESTDQDAIYGDDVRGNTFIHHNQLKADDAGINIEALIINEEISSTFRIEHNQIETRVRDAVSIDTKAQDGATYNETVIIHNNQLSSTGSSAEGIYLDLAAEGAGTLINREIYLTNNSITTDQEGIRFEAALAEDNTEINDKIVITGNTITTEEEGIHLGYVYADGTDAAVNRTILVSHNTISSETNTGIYHGASESKNGGIIHDQIEISHNHVLTSSTGIEMGELNVANADGELHRNLIIQNNTLRDHTAFGIYLGEVDIDNGGLLNHTALVANNDIKSDRSGFDDNVGIAYDTEVIDAASSLNEQITIRDNRIESLGRAIQLDIYASGGVITSDFQISHNTLISNGEDGIHIINRTDPDAATSDTRFSTTINANTITAEDDAIELINSANGSFASMTATVSDNTLTSDSDGIVLDSDITDQHLTASGNRFDINNNTITNNGAGSCSGDDCP